jgi:MFS family permease
MPEPERDRRGETLALLRIANFRRFCATTLATTLGGEIQATAVGWQLYEVTRDPLSLGLAGLAEALPAIAVSLVAGHVADTASRRAVAMWAMATLGLCSFALAGLAFSGIQAHLQWVIYGILMASGLGRGFVGPARSALGVELVPRELLAASANIRGSMWQMGMIVGPACGGGLIALGGVRAAYATDAALMVVGILGLAAIRHQPRPLPPREPIGESLKGGIRFVFAQKAMLAAISLDLFAVLFGGAVALLPIFAGPGYLAVGAYGFGALRAAPAAGAVLMALYLAHRPQFAHAGRAMLLAVGVFGLCMLGFGLSQWFWLSLALLALSGATDYVSVVVRQTMVQVMTPEHLLGRVSAVNSVFIGCSNEVGAFESGAAARILGVRPSVVIGGAITVGIVLATAVGIPQLRRLGRIEGPGERR